MPWITNRLYSATTEEKRLSNTKGKQYNVVSLKEYKVEAKMRHRERDRQNSLPLRWIAYF